MYTKQEHCRICGEDLKIVLNLGDIYPTAWLSKDEELPSPAPLSLAECPNCGLVQLAHSVEQDELYRNYFYRSGINASMVKALEDIVLEAQKYRPLENEDVVVDIGANDCTLLSFYPESVVTVAYEPSSIVYNQDNFKPDLIVNDYFNAEEYPLEHKASIITSIAMFYDLPDPRKFVQDIKNILRDDGLWIIQIGDFKSMLETNAFDTICHEHLEYYKVEDITNLVKSQGLNVFRIDHNEVNGGSLRFYIDRGLIPEEESVRRFITEEYNYYNSEEGTIKAFTQRVNRSKIILTDWLESLSEPIYGLGASTKGNTLLQYFGITPDMLQAIGDLNPEKFGTYTVGTNIPVVSEAEVFAAKPKYLLLLIWQYLPFFLEKLHSYLEDGGTLVVPLPDPCLYTMNKDGIITKTLLV